MICQFSNLKKLKQMVPVYLQANREVGIDEEAICSIDT